MLHLPAPYLNFPWRPADGLKKSEGSREGDMGPKRIPKGCVGVLILGDMGLKGIGDVYSEL